MIDNNRLDQLETRGEGSGEYDLPKTIGVRLREDDAESRAAIESLLGHQALRGLRLSDILRFAIHSAAKDVQAGEHLGAEHRSLRRAYDPPIDTKLAFLAYRSAYQREDFESYRLGKAQGDADRANGRLIFPSPLRLNSPYDVGVYDGQRGGYLAGYIAGRSDCGCGEPFTLPEGDPLCLSNYSIGYRRGFRPKGHYNLGVRAGEKYRDRDEGGEWHRNVQLGAVIWMRPGEESVAYVQDSVFEPDSDMGELPECEPGDIVDESFLHGYNDGIHGGFAAGVLEGQVDSANGNQTTVEGDAAFSDFGFGYRTGCRYPVGEPINTEDNNPAEYEAGKEAGRTDRVEGVPRRDADAATPFASGYRSVSDSEHEPTFNQGMWDGEYDRDLREEDQLGRGGRNDTSDWRAGYDLARSGYRHPRGPVVPVCVGE